MGKVQELRSLIREFNQKHNVPEIHKLFRETFPKEEFPEAYCMQLGYDGGYSWRLVGNRLTDYMGVPLKEEDIREDVKSYFDDLSGGDFAFGTMVIETSPDIAHQIYTTDGVTWQDDIADFKKNTIEQAVIGGAPMMSSYLALLRSFAGKRK